MTKSAINKATKTYAGLDVSLKETAICIVDDAGKIVFERMVPTDPQVIAKCLAQACSRPRALRPGERRHIGLAVARVSQARIARHLPR